METAPRRPATAIWLAWGLALAGGLGVVVAAVLVTRTDLDVVCRDVASCAAGLPTAVRVLAFGGTAVAVVGGLIATVLAVRWLTRRDLDGPSASLDGPRR